MKVFNKRSFPNVIMTALGYGKGINAKPHNPIYGFDSIPIIDKINSGQLDEISYVEGEEIVND
ncbi:hypothetical protein [Lactobacillus sp. PV034]|uniref:hypothetical protein n=1 Tax=Lactobacillus sp. PV034 TaxID=2594495 RepID=UPI002240086B|nr:hypothetical protein [Lactobacillus sp. PV034]QNQ80812.1 hypothetical protein FP432_04205 [Lactobacillus sp. PV034]